MAVLQNAFCRKHEGSAQVHEVIKASEPSFQQAASEERLDAELVERLQETAPQLQPGQRAQSTSCLDLSRSGSGSDVERLRTLLPSYRPAPDYETAVQHKYRNSAGALPQAAVSGREPVATARAPSAQYLYSSQPEIHYPDVTHGAVYAAAGYGRGVLDVAEGMHLLHLYKAPPPYPTHRLASNSTPDLAVTSQPRKPQPAFQHAAAAGHSLSLSHGYLNVHGHSHGHGAHGTYENLASIFDRPLLVDDTHRNIIYCMPASQAAFLAAPAHAHVHTHAHAHEPIYENIPVGWAGSGSTGAAPNDSDESRAVRSRTQSIQSAPDAIGQHLYANVTHAAAASSNGEQQPPVAEDRSQAAVRTDTYGADSVTDTSADLSTTTTSSSSGGKKRRRWGLLGGVARRHPTEKEKSATLGREKDRAAQKEQQQQQQLAKGRQRWSTGLPRLQPLPPTISKETMVCICLY